MLFRSLELRSAKDVRFLKDIVSSPGFTASCLSESIKWIYIRQEATGAKPWLHHVHGLSTRLQNTTFVCLVEKHADDTASTAGRWAPFESIPTVTPSYVRLSTLTLRNVVFTSKTELVRLVDNFPTLEYCFCERLTFLDPSPAVRPRRLRRRPPPARRAFRCRIDDCKDMVTPIQVALAADIVAPARRMGLDDSTWDTTFHRLLALVPNEPGDAFVYGVPNQSIPNIIGASVRVCRSSVGQDAGSLFAHIDSIALELQFIDVEVANNLAWDGLRPVIDSPHMRCLRIVHGGPEYHDFVVAKRILCSVLRRAQLTWALESGKLQFGSRWYAENYVTSADILLVPTEHTIDGIMITLDITKQAEWLLRPVHSRFEKERKETREHYLQKLVMNRTSGVSMDAVPAIIPSTADSAQGSVVGQMWEAAEGDGPGDEQDEERPASVTTAYRGEGVGKTWALSAGRMCRRRIVATARKFVNFMASASL
ncbi:uncharacterized protein PHACADRAFT_202190 [Phanerochaete carnosa HHB-10118-sp]|uniref:Uncharacterized protein n=1 Tax=Phanerochaete carnosa (strain HHB-10118-sp) TaxID=650164 RepID=K5VQV5_PHACS|nr:uncharacterized protein PHACADRAFT_202190 [Phanerochaete carnosa HHB-10118-sp]EKM48954.1 hypothetical protein PHACADRAFT_202190 [Phanerochaete carnosa HHB-10118-sp]